MSYVTSNLFTAALYNRFIVITGIVSWDLRPRVVCRGSYRILTSPHPSAKPTPHSPQTQQQFTQHKQQFSHQHHVLETFHCPSHMNNTKRYGRSPGTYRKTFTSYEHFKELVVKLSTTTTSATIVKGTSHTTRITTSYTAQLHEGTEKDSTPKYNTIKAIHQHAPAAP